jgi:hypothetical protein
VFIKNGMELAIFENTVRFYTDAQVLCWPCDSAKLLAQPFAIVTRG